MCYEIKKYTDNHYVIYKKGFLFKRKIKHGTESECAKFQKEKLEGEKIKYVDFDQEGWRDFNGG